MLVIRERAIRLSFTFPSRAGGSKGHCKPLYMDPLKTTRHNVFTLRTKATPLKRTLFSQAQPDRVYMSKSPLRIQMVQFNGLCVSPPKKRSSAITGSLTSRMRYTGGQMTAGIRSEFTQQDARIAPSLNAQSMHLLKPYLLTELDAHRGSSALQ
jgi:hypothetical protein